MADLKAELADEKEKSDKYVVLIGWHMCAAPLRLNLTPVN